MASFASISMIRKQDYAVSNGERSPEILGVAAPILNAGGELAAVLMAAMPSAGISKNRHGEIAKKIVRCSKKISNSVIEFCVQWDQTRKGRCLP